MKNYTPHDVIIRAKDGSEFRYPTIGNCRACSTQALTIHRVSALTGARILQHGEPGASEVPMYSPPEFTGVEWSPNEPRQGAVVIVSILAADPVARARPDLEVIVPDTGPMSAVRDARGRIVAVRRLILWHMPPPEKPSQVHLVECFNPPNPFDGWEIVRSYPYDAEGLADAMAEGARRGGPALLIDIPDGMPVGFPGDFHEWPADLQIERAAKILADRAAMNRKYGRNRNE